MGADLGLDEYEMFDEQVRQTISSAKNVYAVDGALENFRVRVISDGPGAAQLASDVLVGLLFAHIHLSN